METKGRQHVDLLETNWKQEWRATMETNMETITETNGDHMETKC